MDDVVFFKDPKAFRDWLRAHHDQADQLWVGYYKKGTGKPSITWPESVDEALCFGWIDGLRKSIDEERYRIRFTPRRAGSNWSLINLGRVKELKKQGRMQSAGLQAFERRKASKAPYSYEKGEGKLPEAFEAQLRASQRAWEFFSQLNPSSRKQSVHWVLSAKREETRIRRLAVLVKCSENGEKIPPLVISRKDRGR